MNELIHVRVPASARIVPPALGLVLNQPTLKYEVEAAAGVQSPAPVPASVPLGSFVIATPGAGEGFRPSSSLAYPGAPRAGHPPPPPLPVLTGHVSSVPPY